MEFLQPGWLLGALGIALPILIHFWYQKKAQPLPWAASRWLAEKATLQHRGLRLHDILLLLVRCLLIVLLALILAQPLLNILKNSQEKQVIHLVEPDASLVSNYRFELENALKKGEKLIWISPESQIAENLTDLPVMQNADSYLQQIVNANTTAQDSVKIYITNDQQMTTLPTVLVASPFQVLIFDKKQKDQMPDLAALFAEKNIKASILINYKNKEERETVRAALEAFGEIYKVKTDLDTVEVSNKHYEFVLANALPGKGNTTTEYIISGQNVQPDLPGNVHILPDSLRFKSSDLIKTGQLPEWLGELLISHFQLDSRYLKASRQQIAGRFVRVNASRTEEANAFRKWLLLPFLLLLIVERWLALRKTLATYA